MSAYFIVDQLEVTDPETMKKYAAGVQATLEKYNARALVRGGAFEVIEGGYTPKRMVVLQFADKAAFRRWYDSPEYAELKRMRLGSSKSNAVLVEGV